MQRIQASCLVDAAYSALVARRVPNEDAEKVARVLIDTSLRGVDTHGIRLLPFYARLLDLGKAKARPSYQLSSVAKAAWHLAADSALGPVAATDATMKAIGLAKEFGVGTVAVSGANHFGSAGHYALTMADRDCVGLVLSNADALVAPFAGTRPFFGTNPLAIAAPAENGDSFCLDMATSQTSFSQVMLRKETGTPLLPGWALDASGRETLNGDTSAALQPLGGYKGQGLAMAVEILCTLLSGADFDHLLASVLEGTPAKRQSIGQLFVCIDIAPFCAATHFRKRLSSLLEALLREKPRGHDPILYAGQQEAMCRRDRLSHGIPLAAEVMAEIIGLSSIEASAAATPDAPAAT